MTVTGGVGEPRGAARARTSATCPGARGREDRRSRSTAAWCRCARLGRRSEGGSGVHEASLALDARPTDEMFAEGMLCGLPASEPRCRTDVKTGAEGVAILEIYRLALLCFPSSDAYVTMGTGVGRPSSRRSPCASATATAAAVAETAGEGGGLGGDEAPLPSSKRRGDARHLGATTLAWLNEGRGTGAT